VARLRDEARALPRAVDEVQPLDRRMALEHVARVRVDERVDLACGARFLSTWKTGEARSTSPWWRSFTTRRDARSRELTASGTKWMRGSKAEVG
jgi:hypothetical protein